MANDEELYKYIVERACDGICIIQDKLLKFINRYLSELTGYTIEECLDTSFIDYLDLDEISKVSNKYISLNTGQEDSQRYDTVLINKSGEKIDVEINAGIITYNGQPAILAFIRDISERKQYEKELRESEANYRGLVENMLEGVFRTLPNGEIMAANPALVKMLGYSSEKELLENCLAQKLYVNPEDRVRLTEQLEKTGELRNVEYQLKQKDGNIITVMENARLVRNEIGYVLFYEGVLTDISKRKKFEEQNQLLSSISEQSIEGIALVDLNGNIQYINDAFAEMHGYTVDDLIGKNLSIFHTEDQMPEVNKANEEIKRTGRFQGEIWHTKKNGEVFPTLMNNSILYDKNKHPAGMIGTVLDITEYKNATKALKESEERYRTLQNNIPVAIFRTTNEGVFVSGNPTLATILGHDSVDKIIGTPYTNYYQNKEIADEIFRRLDLEGTVKDYEMEFIRRDGIIVWLLLNIKAEFNANGEFEYIDGMIIDITDRKEAEKKLLATLNQLNATLNTLPDILFEVDSTGKILDYRAPNQSLLYRPPDEFLGKLVIDTLPPKVSQIIMDAIKKAEKDGQCMGSEYCLEVDNKRQWFELSIAIKGEPQTGVSQFIAMARDITNRKNNAELLKKASENLKEEQKELKEKNIALKQILKQIEEDRQAYRRQLYLDIDKTIKPYMSRLKKIVQSDCQKDIEALESSLNMVLDKDFDDFKGRFSRLTARETEICRLIEKGLTSKQISDELNLSVLTVSKHREKIRKKLELDNKDINLATHLRTHNYGQNHQ